jgi:hypothetical protein
VLRAVLDEVIAQLGEYLVHTKVTPDTIHFVQRTLDGMLAHVHFRGTQVIKLIAINVAINGSEATIHFKPMSEDGAWLLEKMDVTKPPAAVKFDRGEEKVAITRVLDL